MMVLVQDLGGSLSKYGVGPSYGHIGTGVVAAGKPSKVYKQGNGWGENLEFKFTCTGPAAEGPLKDFMEKYISVGDYAERGFEVPVYPMLDRMKCKQKVNFLRALAMVIMMRLEGDSKGDVELYIAVPPVEIEAAREEFANLIGTYSIDVIGGGQLKDRHLEFNIVRVTCCEETLVTGLSFLFTPTGPRFPELMQGTLLVIDCGAFTTDVSLIKNGLYIDSSQETLHIGGALCRDALKSEMFKRYELSLSLESLDEVMQTGHIQLGGEDVMVLDAISAAKDHYAAELYKELMSYFKRSGVDRRMLKALLLSGGGALRCCEGDLGLAERLAKLLEVKGIVYPDDPRMACVKGLQIKAMFDASSAAKRNS